MSGVLISSGTRSGGDGFDVGYDLYQPASGPQQPLPAFVLVHGFAGKRAHLAGHAMRLAAAGAVALLPDMSPLMQGGSREAAQRRNVEALADHAEWLLGLPLAGGGGGASPGLRLVDAARLVLGGHSAGGAVAFEACGVLSRRRGDDSGRAVPVLCVLLDGVPWPRTTLEAPRFPLSQTAIVSLRSEPSAWNMNCEVLKALAAVASAADAAAAGARLVDVLIRGSRHADPVDPKEAQCLPRALGLLGPAAAWEAYAALLAAVGADVCALKGAGDVAALATFDARVAALEASGAVEVSRGAALAQPRSR